LEKIETGNSKGESIDLTPEIRGDFFKNLKCLVLIKMNLNFAQLKKISSYFPNVEEMLLCYNFCNDFEVLEESDTDFETTFFPKLTNLNLEKCEIDSSKHNISLLSKFSN